MNTRRGALSNWECSGVGGVRGGGGGDGGEGGGEEGGAAIPGEGVVWFATVWLPWATRCTPPDSGKMMRWKFGWKTGGNIIFQFGDLEWPAD